MGRPCTKCGKNARVKGQRWCRTCLSEYQRTRRKGGPDTATTTLLEPNGEAERQAVQAGVIGELPAEAPHADLVILDEELREPLSVCGSCGTELDRVTDGAGRNVWALLPCVCAAGSAREELAALRLETVALRTEVHQLKRGLAAANARTLARPPAKTAADVSRRTPPRPAATDEARCSQFCTKQHAHAR